MDEKGNITSYLKNAGATTDNAIHGAPQIKLDGCGGETPCIAARNTTDAVAPKRVAANPPIVVRDVEITIADQVFKGAVIVAHREDLKRLVATSGGLVRVSCADLLSADIDGLPPSLAKKVEKLPRGSRLRHLPKGTVLVQTQDLVAMLAIVKKLNVPQAQTADGGRVPPTPPNGGNGLPDFPDHEQKVAEDCDETKQCCLHPEICTDLKEHTTSVSLSCGPLEVELSSQGELSLTVSL
jgi:hypothetical protein